jgi:type II secretory pathway pseudopilin PulG
MIALILMIAVAVLLVIAFPIARRCALRLSQLELDNQAIRRELERHRDVARSILEELQNS